MHVGRRITTFVLGFGILALLSGCVTLDEHRRLQAQNRQLAADKQALSKDLFDARSGSESMRTRFDAVERELKTKDELVTNLRSENEVLDEMRRMAMSEMEKLGGQQTLGAITISGPKLPKALNTALEQFASQHPSMVSYDSVRGTMKWQSDLLFALGSDVVKDSSLEALREFADVIKSDAAADFEVIVVGHTDNRPIVRPETKQLHPTNWHLSGHRAISVASVLTKFGYSPGRIGVMGYGAYRPAADNRTEKGASLNRRVEIFLVPKSAVAP